MADFITEVKTEATPASFLGARILALCQELPQGVSDKLLQASMPDVDPKERASAINALLSEGKIDLFKSAEKGLLYRARQTQAGSLGGEAGGGTSKGGANVHAGGAGGGIKGDAEEKLVYKIIQEAGNKGTWIRDIRIKSNLVQTQLNKVLKSLKGKKLIKDVKSVNSTRKIVYMLYEVEPDRSVTGGAWYSDQDFESEFVEILNQQCYRFLFQKLEKSRESLASSGGPLAVRNGSQASSTDVLKYISELGISKVQLKVDDIEAILDTLIYDGKVEKMLSVAEEDQEVRYYRAVESLLPSAGLMRVPCGGCPVIKDCSIDAGSVNPVKCKYITEWLS